MPCLSSALDYRIETVVDGLDRPYGIAFLPGGDILVSEQPGRLRIIRDGLLLPDPVSGVPDVYTGQQGGLLEIALHPRFEENGFLYFSLSQGTEDANTMHVFRGRYNTSGLHDVIKIFTAVPAIKDSTLCSSHRMVFLPDETLLITVGDGFDYREEAQNLGSTLGKIVRVNDDGQIPKDNPFINQSNAQSEIWSYGHRCALGIVYDRVTHTVYAHENGPKGGDELNLIQSGKNYGWPIATHGIDYTGAYISPFKAYPGTEQPMVQWTPALAPSGMTQCRNCQWREWEGDLFIGMMRGQQVRRVSIKNNVVTEQEALFENLGEHIRNLRFGPDGALYLLTKNTKGRVLKVSLDTVSKLKAEGN